MVVQDRGVLHAWVREIHIGIVGGISGISRIGVAIILSFFEDRTERLWLVGEVGRIKVLLWRRFSGPMEK